jgi:hypothetical protein
MATPLEFHFAQLSFLLHSFPSSNLRYKQPKERLPVAKGGHAHETRSYTHSTNEPEGRIC